MRCQYRCDQCRTTSPTLYGHAELDREQRVHRRDFHGGHAPDGERTIEIAPWRPSDVPREQWAIAGLFLIAFLIATWARFG